MKTSRFWMNMWVSLFVLGILSIFSGCQTPAPDVQQSPESKRSEIATVTLVVLGTIQDGGSPHIGCKKKCCKDFFNNPDPQRRVVSLGLIDPTAKKTFIIEATPDLAEQMKALKKFSGFQEVETPDGILLTHAHIGHYAGLMFLGKEAMNADQVPVYAMPRMKIFLETNGPWSQLVNNQNIAITELHEHQKLILTPELNVIPFKVPHRDEYSETVGYTIIGPNKRALFIPDIDKWEKWDKHIIEELAKVDYAFLDATFYDAEEINHRDISEIPHPFVSESLEHFKALSAVERNKIHFIHFNHTNPLIDSISKQSQNVREQGFHVASIGSIINL